ncbi:MAG TPA: di-heme oxidoredictase family protein [Oscillatoriaceae cyanobacterium]
MRMRSLWLLCLGALLISGYAAPAPDADPVRPLPGLDAGRLAAFARGRALFEHNWSPEEGLGPLYNDTSCRACHGRHFTGDGSERFVTLVGGLRNGAQIPLVPEGGPAIQDRAIAGVPVEQMPVDARFVSKRISPPTMGLGLIEAIAPSDITAQLAADPLKESLGIRGLANWEFRAIGRFGWKAQKGDIVEFTQNAGEFEMGLSTPGRAREDFPGFHAIPLAKAAGFADSRQPWIAAYFERLYAAGHAVGQPDIGAAQLADLVAFQRYSAPVAPLPPTPERERGRRVFAELHCDVCHTPMRHTSANDVGVPAGLPVPLYSDLLVHDMGPAMDDGLIQGVAKGAFWRTSPLWGLRYRRAFLHDGRAGSIDGAIRMHGGEAARVIDAYRQLDAQDRQDLRAFLKSL